MIQIDYFKVSQQEDDSGFTQLKKPEFLSYIPDTTRMEKLVDTYSHLPNMIVIGHGGSIQNFIAIHEALKYRSRKVVHIVNTIDPFYVDYVKNSTNPNNTLVVVISKSGNTTTILEVMAQFSDYPFVVISEGNTPLHQLCQSRGFAFLLHPPVGGRFAGLTEAMLFPALMCGYNITDMLEGSILLRSSFNSNNRIASFARAVYELEKKGYTEMYVPIYSKQLNGFQGIIAQLVHETLGKDGKGISVIAAEAPEAQHHTAQRFFGGRKNILGVFIGTHSFDSSLTNQFPKSWGSLAFRNSSLTRIDGVGLREGMWAELRASLQEAYRQDIPSVLITIERINEKSLGEFLTFWQIFVLYYAELSEVNAYDQPAVEKSKDYSWEYRTVEREVSEQNGEN